MKQAFWVGLLFGLFFPSLLFAPPSPKPLKRIAIGELHTCAVASSGAVKCWGNNGYGQLGNGSQKDSSIPIDVEGLSSAVVAIAAGKDHTCVLTSFGRVKCWGDNEYGQLGNGTRLNSPTPVDVTELSGVSAISAGSRHTCALTTSGTVKCWGNNKAGQLGDGSRKDSATPLAVKGLSDAVAIAAGGWHTCALTNSGTVKCWGANSAGQLGIGSRSGPKSCESDNNKYPCSTTPVAVRSLSDVIALAAGGAHTCALTSSGKVRCWGQNLAGQLGNGTSSGPEDCGFPCSTIPVAVRSLSDVVDIAAGAFHTCALTSSQGVKCWGDNWAGQLGNGRSSRPETCDILIKKDPCSTIPLQVEGLSGILAIAAGASHTCALTSSGKVKCWGSNSSGELGDGSTKNSSTPVAVKFEPR